MSSSTCDKSRECNDIPTIYLINGDYLVFDSKSALSLRRNRIVGRLIGCPVEHPYQVATSGLPLHLSLYEVDVVVLYNLANFVKLTDCSHSTQKTRKEAYSSYLNDFFAETQEEFKKTRIAELNKRNIPVSEKNLNPLDISKLKVPVPSTPDERFSSHVVEQVSKERVKELIASSIDNARQEVFRDLYRRGFYMTSGLKFGSDFLAYLGDPIGYHAQYAVRLMSGDAKGNVDLTKEDFHEINALFRLCHTACKVSLLVTINQDITDDPIKYWTLKYREFLTPLSRSDSLLRHNPRLIPDKTIDVLDSNTPVKKIKS